MNHIRAVRVPAFLGHKEHEERKRKKFQVCSPLYSMWRITNSLCH